MGLDSVELLMDIEESFGVSISQVEAEQIYTVQDLVDSVSSKIDVVDTRNCVAQILFFRLRSFFRIKEVPCKLNLKTKLKKLGDLHSVSALLQEFGNEHEIKFPELGKGGFFKVKDINLSDTIDYTIRVAMQYNYELLNQQFGLNQSSVAFLARSIIHTSTGVPVHKIEGNASITYDLGID